MTPTRKSPKLDRFLGALALGLCLHLGLPNFAHALKACSDLLITPKPGSANGGVAGGLYFPFGPAVTPIQPGIDPGSGRLICPAGWILEALSKMEKGASGTISIPFYGCYLSAACPTGNSQVGTRYVRVRKCVNDSGAIQCLTTLL